MPLAIIAALVAGSANADSIYINVGNDYEPSASDNAQSVNCLLYTSPSPRD